MSQEAKTLYSGTFERSMDAKKRVAVPAPWLTRDEGETFHIIPHPAEGYLMVMPAAEFDRWEHRIQESQATPAEKRMAIRKFYSEAHTATTDRQGRILLSEKHCDRAGLCRWAQPLRDLEPGPPRGRGSRPFRGLQTRRRRHRPVTFTAMQTGKT
jgi:MraZ protein